MRDWTLRRNIVSANAPTMRGGWGPAIIQTPDVTIDRNTISGSVGPASACAARNRPTAESAGNFTAASAATILDSGLIQLAVFGRPFIANPDLVERLKTNAPLAAPRQDLLYTPEAEGYSDYPALGS